MNHPPPFDTARANQVFASDCFNRTWALLDQTNRSEQDDEQMTLLSLTSLWHWTQRDDCTDQTLSVGYWLVSRVYAVLQQADNASHYAQRCLSVSQSLPPFYQGYAHEAIARALSLQGNTKQQSYHQSEARQLAAQITDSEERSMLEKDLAELS